MVEKLRNICYKALVLSMLLIVATSCRELISDDIFLEDSGEYALVIKGKVLMSQAHEPLQYSANKDRLEFRVMNDDCSQYYYIKCSELPLKQDMTINCSLKWFDMGRLNSKNNLSFTVIRSSADSRSLWCDSQRIGVTFRLND